MHEITALLTAFLGASPAATAATVFIFDIPRDLLSLAGLALGRRHKGPPPSTEVPPGQITLVIPVLNDAEGLLVSLQSIRRQRHRPAQIIVVSDGSTDITNAVLTALHQRGEIDRLIINDRRLGRGVSGNVALHFVTTEFVMFIDCDTKLAADALEALQARLMDRPEAGACSGNIAINNHRASLWTALQQLEYMVAIDFGREFADNFSAMACCSGALSMFRTEHLRHIGGFSPGSGEDLGTTLRFRRAGYEVHFEADAWAYTNAPVSLRALIQQRLRWDRDAFRLQILQYRQWKKQSVTESLGNTLQRYDYILFTLLPTLMMPFLLPIIASVPAAQRPAFIGGGYMFLVGVAVFTLAPAFIAYRGRTPVFLLLLLPIYPAYQGIMMKAVRLYAYLSEAVGHASRGDHYVPARIRARLDQSDP